MNKPAQLILSDGTIYRGNAIGQPGMAFGEIVFNTSHTGYQEIITDPSYSGQIVCFTFPHIGVVGINDQDNESHRIGVSGIVVRHLSTRASNWRAQMSLVDYLNSHNIVGISDIDTRALTHRLREGGSLKARILSGDTDETHVLTPCESTVTELEGLETLTPTWSMHRFHVVIIDFGVKHTISRLLIDRGCRMTVVPSSTIAKKILALEPDGVVLSNGPGDPNDYHIGIKTTQDLMKHKVPIFGICLGLQILSLACGASTFKMKFGHHGTNHPVYSRMNKKVYVTSQNHQYAVDEKTLPPHLTITHHSLFDHTIQGLQHRTLPLMGFQGHPEGSPGPHDLHELFDCFIGLVKSRTLPSPVISEF